MRKLIFIAFNMHAAHGAYQQCGCRFLADSPLPGVRVGVGDVAGAGPVATAVCFGSFVVRCLFLVAHLLDASCQICKCRG